VIEKKAMHRAIASGYEGIREATDVESLDALLAIVSASEELNACVWVIGVEVGDLLR